MSDNPTVFIAAIGSGIGSDLAALYRARGCTVIGTYRTAAHIDALRDQGGIELIQCDVARPDSIAQAAEALRALGKPWDIFIGAVGQLDPIGSFFDCDADQWADSVMNNSVSQLRLLHTIYPHRNTAQLPSKAAFLVGGGINGPFRHYSAYCLAKVMLVKFCELIDDEYPDIHAVAIGTGWVNTRIHQQTLDAAERAGANLERTTEFLKTGATGTSVSDILACMDWCFAQDRSVTGGRNFSVVHDGWRDGGQDLAQTLAQDVGMYKLRRTGA